jgi:hypothetical protein
LKLKLAVARLDFRDPILRSEVKAVDVFPSLDLKLRNGLRGSQDRIELDLRGARRARLHRGLHPGEMLLPEESHAREQDYE